MFYGPTTHQKAKIGLVHVLDSMFFNLKINALLECGFGAFVCVLMLLLDSLRYSFNSSLHGFSWVSPNCRNAKLRLFWAQVWGGCNFSWGRATFCKKNQPFKGRWRGPTNFVVHPGPNLPLTTMVVVSWARFSLTLFSFENSILYVEGNHLEIG